MTLQTSSAHDREQSEDRFVLRKPSVGDAAAILQIVRESGLDENSCYAYLLLTSHFSDTCIVAEADGKLIGFVAAYFPPNRSSVIFVWQIAVAEEARGTGLGNRLLHALVRMPNVMACADYLEATVTPSNEASRRLFTSFALDFGTEVTETTAFTAANFGNEGHEEERLLRIGPLEGRS